MRKTAHASVLNKIIGLSGISRQPIGEPPQTRQKRNHALSEFVAHPILSLPVEPRTLQMGIYSQLAREREL